MSYNLVFFQEKGMQPSTHHRNNIPQSGLKAQLYILRIPVKIHPMPSKKILSIRHLRAFPSEDFKLKRHSLNKSLLEHDCPGSYLYSNCLRSFELQLTNAINYCWLGTFGTLRSPFIELFREREIIIILTILMIYVGRNSDLKVMRAGFWPG